MQNDTTAGLDPVVCASEALGLTFAFGNENGDTGFAVAFGPENPNMTNSTAGDAAFAAAAASIIFGSASTDNLVNALENWIANWKAFYVSHGVPGISDPTEGQTDLAARAAAWGDGVGFALVGDVGPLKEQVINFLNDAAQGTAVYSASLESQPDHAVVSEITNDADALVHLIGIAAPLDHFVI